MSRTTQRKLFDVFITSGLFGTTIINVMEVKPDSEDAIGGAYLTLLGEGGNARWLKKSCAKARRYARELELQENQ